MKKLVRRKDGDIGGVCGGIADYFSISGKIVRLLFLIGIFTNVPTIFIYVLLWILIPKEKNNEN